MTEYLRAWAHKMGSRVSRLWYVDVFSGPWQSKHENLQDTSIWIGLRALEEAAQTWNEQGKAIELGAVFVEKRREAYKQLKSFLDSREGTVRAVPLRGEFGEQVERIRELIGDDCAFVFVDPTGFKGVEMRFIAPLVEPRCRDVLINVMFNDVNRWKDDPREFLREQMGAFFGLGDDDLPEGLEEKALLQVYRAQLKRRTGIDWAADIAVPHPTFNRTWFRLVIGGRHPKVLEVFRDAERKVMGGEADLARTDAKIRADTQPNLFTAEQISVGTDPRYAELRDESINRVMPMLEVRLADGPLVWQRVWPALLEELHLSLSELSRYCFEAARAGKLQVTPMPSSRRQTLRDEDVISLPPRSELDDSP